MKTEAAIIALVTGVVLMAIHVYAFLYTPPSHEHTTKTVFIQQGASFGIIARELEKEGIVSDSEKFMLLAKFKDAIKQTKAGEYEFTTSMLPSEVLSMILNGQIKNYTITIPEGYTIRDIARLLDSTDIVKKDIFMEKAMDPLLANSLGIDSMSVEGYLFPDTYRFVKGMRPEEVIKKMVQRFNKIYSEIIDKKNDELKMSQKQVVTLASIIEKETGDISEGPIISAVFHNRLRKQMRLESDPTVIYGISDFNGNLTKKDLRTKTPYNTYRIYGLPPGPIANPGRSSLEAAVNPSNDPYLYFVSRNDGTHHFSKTLREHNRAVYLYQKKPAKSNQLLGKN